MFRHLPFTSLYSMKERSPIERLGTPLTANTPDSITQISEDITLLDRHYGWYRHSCILCSIIKSKFNTVLPLRRYHSLDQDVGALELTDVLPPPVAADLNGDGRVEVITATHNARLHVRTSQLKENPSLRP